MLLHSLHSPQWADASHTSINLLVTLEGHGEVPFTARADDVEQHGRDLFLAASSGALGAVAEYLAPVKSPEQLKLELTRAVQRHMDEKARLKGYDDIRSAALRAGFPGPFHDEGVIYAAWMDSCWATCYAVMAEVQAGNRPVPSEAELIAALPVAPVVP